jgi:peroxiredoxin
MMHRREAMLSLAASGLLAAAAKPLEGQPALPGPLDRYRDMPLRAADGTVTTLGRLLGRRRPTVVSFWATWCAPCALEGRKLAELRNGIPDTTLAMVGVNIDTTPDPVRLSEFRRKAQMTFTQALEGQPLYQTMTGQERLALPRTFVFDAAGQPTAAFGRFFGGRTLAAIEAAVRAVV